MRLILALQMSWCTRRRSSKPSLTSLTRRLQKCQATKLARNTARPSPALDLPPLNFTFSLHFRDRPPFPGKARKSAPFVRPTCPATGTAVVDSTAYLLPTLTLAWSSPYDEMHMLRFCVCDSPPLFVKIFSPPLPSITTASFCGGSFYFLASSRGSYAF